MQHLLSGLSLVVHLTELFEEHFDFRGVVQKEYFLEEIVGGRVCWMAWAWPLLEMASIDEQNNHQA
jgi:hypothetical protein